MVDTNPTARETDRVTNELSEQLRTFSSELAEVAKGAERVEPLIGPLEEAAAQIAVAWSGSNLGFHSTVYHASLSAPPPGEHFNAEWGFIGMFEGTTGDWKEFPRQTILDRLRKDAGDPDLTGAKIVATQAEATLQRARGEGVSIIRAFVSGRTDEYLSSLETKIAEARALTEAEAVQAQLPNGQVISRDSTAISQGWKPAPHQEVLAEVVAIRTPFLACKELAKLLERAASHMDRVSLPSSAKAKQQGTNVFIGHGRSLLWRELKDFVQDRMGLPSDEFNRVPVAGVTNIARLSQMLDDAGIAFLVLTAEDESTDGVMTARQNVVHEAGLFQGRLGFTRAIVLLEEGCAEFSNIQGLGQIRFPKGSIGACFEEVRRVLEREGLARG